MSTKSLISIGLTLWLTAFSVLFFSAEPDSEVTRFFGLWRTRYIGIAALLFVLSIIPLTLAYSRCLCLKCMFGFLQVGVALLILEAVGLAGLLDYSALLGRATIPTNSLGSIAVPHLDESGETFQDIAFRRGLEHEPIPFQYKTGRYGFRNPSDPGVGDVYLLGDSIVVGATLPYEQTIAGRLATSMSLNVLNIALIGASVQEEQVLMKSTELPFSNRLVLQFVFEGNDLLDSLRFRESEEQNANRNEVTWRRGFLYNLLIAVQRLTDNSKSESGRDDHRCLIGGQSYEFLFMANSFLGLEMEQAEIFRAISDFEKDVKAAGGTFGVVFVPSKFRVLSRLCELDNDQQFAATDHLGPLYSSISEWSTATSIPMLDVTPALLRSAEGGQVPFFWGDTHLNASGHRVLTDEIFRSSLISEWLTTRDGRVSDQE